MKSLRLGVNIDHVATVRNARGGDNPDPIRAALMAQAGKPWAYYHAHNEYLQLAYEGGAVALALLAAWLWTHRRAFRGAHGPSLVALGLVAVAWFPFHVAAMAGPLLVLLGLATAPVILTDEECARALMCEATPEGVA